uniref:Uncharacterized protein n=1 Tax=Rhizophora mucronata TaxID=61149 RepID=A0A2P2QE39_RHIMU
MELLGNFLKMIFYCLKFFSIACNGSKGCKYISFFTTSCLAVVASTNNF